MRIRLSINIQLTVTAIQAYLWVCDLHCSAERLLGELINVQFTLRSNTLSADANNNLNSERGTGNILSYAHYCQRPSLHVESNTYGLILTLGSAGGAESYATKQPVDPMVLWCSYDVPMMNDAVSLDRIYFCASMCLQAGLHISRSANQIRSTVILK